jgi:hypothetical protein
MTVTNLREQICGWAHEEIERNALNEDLSFDVTMAAAQTPQGTNIVQYILVIFMAHPLDSPLPLLGKVPLLGQPSLRQTPLTFLGAFAEPQPSRETVTQMASKGLKDLRQLSAKVLAGQNGSGQ